MLRAFECGVKNTNWKRVVHAMTPGKAKYEFWRDVSECWESVKYTDITVSTLGAPRTDESFRHTAAYRCVPFAAIGMSVEVGGDKGIIVGNNSSANFDVLFEGGPNRGLVLNCHPNWKIRYFGPDGGLIKEFGG